MTAIKLFAKLQISETIHNMSFRRAISYSDIDKC